MLSIVESITTFLKDYHIYIYLPAAIIGLNYIQTRMITSLSSVAFGKNTPKAKEKKKTQKKIFHIFIEKMLIYVV